MEESRRGCILTGGTVTASAYPRKKDREMTQALDRDVLYSALTERFGSRVKRNEPLARHGTFGVGGKADLWVSVTSEDDLLDLVSFAQAQSCPLMLVGNGTNVLYADAGARGIVARMNISAWWLDDVDDDTVRLTAGAGANLPKLVSDLAAQGLSGLEWGIGVPGTVGGAVVSNAGAHGACAGDTLESVRVLFSDGAPVIRELTASALDLEYRHSRFRAPRRVLFDDQGRPVAAPRGPLEPAEMITRATFLLRRAPRDEVQALMAHHRQHRKETQPPQPSAGSVFKNPSGDYSGRLIEAAGLKGARHGNAQISPRHANFIVNTGGATAADIVALIALARHTVRERFGVELELEVEPRGDW